jgi:chromosomal replication initiator protein
MAEPISMRAATDWVTLRENRAAQGAVEQVVECITGSAARRTFNPLFLYGPAGTGKSLLVTFLIDEVTRRAPERQVCLVPAGDFAEWLQPDERDPLPTQEMQAARSADLLVLEDVHLLPERAPAAADTLTALIDRALARQRQVVATANVGPAQLARLPARLTSRLGQGLVVGLELLAPGSRLIFLEQRARARQLGVGREVLAWLADHIPGSPRQLEGALVRLETLIRVEGRSLSLAELPQLLPEEAARQPSLERIVRQVGRFFAVEPRQLCSRRRSHDALLPRQVSMYLARQLTRLSLEQIGAFFGGRDHTTVLHACRKIEEALPHDARIAGAVRQLHADLA